MQLLQISEPQQPENGRGTKRVIGIDLGTTHSLVAAVTAAGVTTLADAQGRHLLPSIVRYAATAVEVGWEAHPYLVQDPQNTLVSTKRLLGHSLHEILQRYAKLPYQFAADDKGMPLLLTPQGKVTPPQIAAEILKVLAQRAKKAVGEPIEGVVVTVPAYFDEIQRQSVQTAVQLAGLPLLRLLNEPTAAAIAYGLDEEREGVIVIYDLGGGTFDVSVLRIAGDIFEVLATGGNTALGGDDFDALIADWLQQQIAQDGHIPCPHARCLQAAQYAKLVLSEQLQIQVQLDPWRGVFTRQQFEQLITPLIQRTLDITQQALIDAEIPLEAVAQVVLVGGATRIPLVRHSVANFFRQQPLSHLDPDRIVAIGAALQAERLAGNPVEKELLLLDVTPLSLGIETLGGSVAHIIPRNRTLPVTASQKFTTCQTNQQRLLIHVLQGEGKHVSACRSLAYFELHGIPPLPAGTAQIQVTFQLDNNGLLTVTAIEQTTGINTQIQVRPLCDLTESQMHSMLNSDG